MISQLPTVPYASAPTTCIGQKPGPSSAAVGLVYVITALTSLPGLWSGRRATWHLLTCVIAALVLFSCYKILVEGEIESVVFLIADLVAAGLLLLPATRRHVSA